MTVAWIKVVAVEGGEVVGPPIGSILRVKPVGFADGKKKRSAVFSLST